MEIKGVLNSHFFIAKGLRKVAEPVVDDMEESKIVFVSDESVMRSVLGGEISTLAAASLAAIAMNPLC
jgi:type III secretion system FlhB-like substrate exporter